MAIRKRHILLALLSAVLLLSLVSSYALGDDTHHIAKGRYADMV